MSAIGQQPPHSVMKLPSIGIIVMGVVLAVFGTWIFIQVYWSCSGGAALMTLGTSILGYPIIPGLGDTMAAVVTGGNLTDSMSGRPSFIEYISPPAGDGVEWSRIQCVGWHRNRSCAFDNIYYDKTDDTFYILLPSDPLLRGNIMRAPYDGKALQYHNSPITYHEDTGIPVTEDTIRELTNGCQRGITFRRFQPEIIFADGEEGLVSWRATIAKGDISALDGISVYFSLMWTWNVGHFMYDSIYPIWVTILRFGYGRDTINLLGYESYDSTSDDVNFPHWDLMRAFSHGGVSGLTSVVLDTNVTRMSRLLVGSRWMNHRHQQRHMGMPGSYSYENALYWYGQRILAGYGILDWDTALDPNTPIMIDDINKRCKGVITDNKRFSDEERSMLKTLADESKDLFGCDITYMNWKDYTFEEQVRLFSDMNIYISAVGTGLTRCHLIKPGGVIVQLPEMELTGNPPRYQVSYQAVHMATGSPHLNSVYYSRKLFNIFGRLVREGVVDAINRGINLARRGYPIPRPYGDGLSPTSQSYEDYCADSPDDCDFLTLARNGGWGVGT
ncbi:hypothetical protein FOZ62_001454, partial [Perkinsus olseni]